MVEKKASSKVLWSDMSNETWTPAPNRSEVITTADQTAHDGIGDAVVVQKGHARHDHPADEQHDDRHGQRQEDVTSSGIGAPLLRWSLPSVQPAAISARSA